MPMPPSKPSRPTPPKSGTFGKGKGSVPMKPAPYKQSKEGK